MAQQWPKLSGCLPVVGELLSPGSLGPSQECDLASFSCMTVIKKFKPKKFKRHDRNHGGKTHIGYVADEPK